MPKKPEKPPVKIEFKYTTTLFGNLNAQVQARIDKLQELIDQNSLPQKKKVLQGKINHLKQYLPGSSVGHTALDQGQILRRFDERLQKTQLAIWEKFHPSPSLSAAPQRSSQETGKKQELKEEPKMKSTGKWFGKLGFFASSANKGNLDKAIKKEESLFTRLIQRLKR